MIENSLPNEGEIVLYQPNESLKLEVRLEQETVWLSQAQMAMLYGTQRQAITKHIKNIYDAEELDRESTSSILELVQKEGNRLVRRNVEFYNLDMIISVGYRINNKLGIQFRRWATSVLKDHLLRGYSINRQLVAIQEHCNERFLKLEQRIDQQQDQIDFFIRTNLPPIEGIFYEGQVLDARLFAEKLIKIAMREVILIDNYIDSRTFDILEMRNPNVTAIIYVERIGKGLKDLQETSKIQTKRIIELKETRQRVHDRFLIIDNEIYHLGASLNELGKRLFAFSKMEFGRDVLLAMI